MVFCGVAEWMPVVAPVSSANVHNKLFPHPFQRAAINTSSFGLKVTKTVGAANKYHRRAPPSEAGDNLREAFRPQWGGAIVARFRI